MNYHWPTNIWQPSHHQAIVKHHKKSWTTISIERSLPLQQPFHHNNHYHQHQELKPLPAVKPPWTRTITTHHDLLPEPLTRTTKTITINHYNHHHYPPWSTTITCHHHVSPDERQAMCSNQSGRSRSSTKNGLQAGCESHGATAMVQVETMARHGRRTVVAMVQPEGDPRCSCRFPQLPWGYRCLCQTCCSVRIQAWPQMPKEGWWWMVEDGWWWMVA